MLIPTPQEFSFEHCLAYLQRSPKELLHNIVDGGVAKALRAGNEVVVFSVTGGDRRLQVGFLSGEPTATAREAVAQYVREWFDLDTDLRPFYRMAQKDSLLKGPVKMYFGYRIVGQPDLFESLVWAVLGQQINLSFAYSLKQRFVETFGEKLQIGIDEYYLFPSPGTVALIKPEALAPLQFSAQKSRYVIGIAEAFASGALSKERIRELPLAEARQELMKVKGVGDWTANYALMKTFRHPDAFPIGDAGLHNAIRNLRHLDRKPTISEVARLFRKYRGWEAYATLYLWKTL